MSNPLVNALTPKVRQILYVLALLASLAFAAWQTSDGDWQKAVGGFISALLLATAASNASPTPKKPKGEGGFTDLGLVLLVIVLLVVVLLFFRVHA